MPPKKKATIRFRRLDRRNFVYETCRSRQVEGKSDEDVWEVHGYFSSLKSAALSALNDGFNGATTLLMLESIKTSTETVVRALEALKLDPSLLIAKEIPEKVVEAVDDEELPAPSKEKAKKSRAYQKPEATTPKPKTRKVSATRAKSVRRKR